MPTIEIIAVDSPSVPSLPRFKGFAYIAEATLVSHRGLFQPVLDKYTGVIVHLANKDFEGTDGAWFAGCLMNRDRGDVLRFLKQPARDARRLLKLMLRASPIGEVLFLSDYQFGPSRKKMERKVLPPERFWAMHDAGCIRYNTLYRIKERSRTTPCTLRRVPRRK